MSGMKASVAISDDLLAVLEKQAAREDLSLEVVVDRLLRHSMSEIDIPAESDQTEKPPQRFKQRTFRLGKLPEDASKLNDLAYGMDDEKILRLYGEAGAADESASRLASDE